MEENPVRVDRMGRGMTQWEYAEFLGFQKVSSGLRQVQRWERVGVRTADALSRLCGATGRPASFFLGQEEEAAAAPEMLDEIRRIVEEHLALVGNADRRRQPGGRRATDREREMIA